MLPPYVVVQISGNNKNNNDTIDKLEEEVKNLIIKGYKPQGGVSVVKCTSTSGWYFTYTQALVRS